jgi:hypothetical protein
VVVEERATLSRWSRVGSGAVGELSEARDVVRAARIAWMSSTCQIPENVLLCGELYPCFLSKAEGLKLYKYD